MNPIFEGTVYGKLPSMKNSRRIVTNCHTRRPMLIKSQEALDYEEIFAAQIPGKSRKYYAGPVLLEVIVYYASDRPDLDVEFLKDLIQKTSIIANDRQIRKVVSEKRIDRGNPRVVFTVRPYPQKST